MQGDPALVVGLVDAGVVLHQEGHHVHVVVDACLETGGEERGEGRGRGTTAMGRTPDAVHDPRDQSPPGLCTPQCTD